MIKIPIRNSHNFCQNSQRARTSNFTPLEAVEPLCKITRKMTQTVQRFVHGLSLACAWLVPGLCLACAKSGRQCAKSGRLIF